MSTGFREASMASSVVRSEQCETSAAIPTVFMRSRICAPYSLKPESLASDEPPPIRLCLYVS